MAENEIDTPESTGRRTFRRLATTLFWFLVVISLIMTILAYTFGYVVYPGEMGVREITLKLPFGPRQGYSENGLQPGYHWSIPVYSRIHFVPQTLQILNLHRDKEEDPNSLGALEVQTTDGSSVDVDFSVLYRFFSARDKDHGGPAELLNTVGYKKHWVPHIQTVVTNELRKVLGRLSASEFYNPSRREKEVAKARQEMNVRLKGNGVEIAAILLRRYTYANTIDEAIFQKNLKDQERQLNLAESRLADAKAQVEQIRGEWDAKIKTLKVKAENDVSVIRSDGDRYQTSKNAEGDLEVAKAKAEVDKLRGGALASSIGADVYVARELAPILSSLKGGVVTQVDPYNFDDWAKKLGLAEEKP